MCCKSVFAGCRGDPGSAFTEDEVLDELLAVLVSTALVTRWKRFAPVGIPARCIAAESGPLEFHCPSGELSPLRFCKSTDALIGKSAVNPWPKLDGNALGAAFPGVAIEIAGVASEALDVWDCELGITTRRLGLSVIPVPDGTIWRFSG